jgi:hypothetical protein
MNNHKKCVSNKSGQAHFRGCAALCRLGKAECRIYRGDAEAAPRAPPPPSPLLSILFILSKCSPFVAWLFNLRFSAKSADKFFAPLVGGKGRLAGRRAACMVAG